MTCGEVRRDHKLLVMAFLAKKLQVCFEDRGDKNLVFLDNKNEALSDVPLFMIEHVDLGKIIGNSMVGDKNMKCFLKKDGKVKMFLEKKFGEDLVNIKTHT